MNNAGTVSQDIFIHLGWKAVQSAVTIQTHRVMFTAFAQISEESFSHSSCREILWLELRSHSQSGGVLALPHVPLLVVNHLPSLRVDFFVCLSVFHRNPSWQDFLVYSHPSLPGSCPLSFLVHHQWTNGLEICWFKRHWFKFRVCW